MTSSVTPGRGQRVAWFLMVTWLLAVAAPGRAAGQEQRDTRLAVDFQRLSPVIRTGAPLSVDWSLSWKGPGLLTGHVDMTILHGREVLELLRTDEIVVNESGYRFRTLLPTVMPDNPLLPLDIQASFVSRQHGTFDLGERSLRVQGSSRRALVLCLVTVIRREEPPAEIAFRDSLSFEQRAPQPLRNAITTYPSVVAPADLPSDPLALCQFNVVVLRPDGFGDLDDLQLEALVDWVDAGGSLAVVPGQSLTPRRADFLNHLLAADGNRPVFTLNDAGRLATRPTGRTLWRNRKGLGRVAITISDPLDPAFVASADWEATVSFLWNRHAHPENLSLLQQLRKRESSVAVDDARRASFTRTTAINWRIPTVGSLVKKLTPQDFEIVPLWLLGFLLAGYVVLIGPVDYLVLGWLRVRRLTWVLFPLVTVAFTAFIIWVSHAYMRTTGPQKEVVFQDLGDDGRVVRESRFRLLLTGTSQTIRTSVRGALFTPLDHSRFGRAEGLRVDDFNQGSRELVGPAMFVGRVPAAYVAIQEMPQWTPQLNRLFQIRPEVDPPRFDFAGVATEELSDPTQRARLADRLRAAFEADVTATVFHLRQVDYIARTVEPVFPPPERANLYQTTVIQTPGGPQVVQRPFPGFETGVADFLSETCVRSSRGLFLLTTRIPPHGGDNFEDLTLLDPTDPSQWLLVVAVQRGDRLMIYRKLYFAEDSGTE